MLLKDKVAIITGAARGMGQHYALRFAEEGARQTVCDVLDCSKTAEEIKKLSGDVLALKTDVSNEADTDNLAKRTIERFGRIDILVNNAAIYGGMKLKPFHEITVEEWDKMMQVNLRGIWLCCKAVFPYMKKQGKGKIINVSSATFFKGLPNMLHYVTSKGGVVGITRALARELGQYNINVNAIAPGLTMTEASCGLSSEERTRKSVEQQSFNRPQMPKDLLGAMVFLASDQSDFVTGQTMVIDGGTYMH